MKSSLPVLFVSALWAAISLSTLPCLATEITYTYMDIHGDEVTKRFLAKDGKKDHYLLDETTRYPFIVGPSFETYADPRISDYERDRLVARHASFLSTLNTEEKTVSDLHGQLVKLISARDTALIHN